VRPARTHAHSLLRARDDETVSADAERLARRSTDFQQRIGEYAPWSA